MSEERTQVEIKLDDGNTFRHTEHGMYDKVLFNITRDIRDDGYLVFGTGTNSTIVNFAHVVSIYTHGYSVKGYDD